MEKLCVFCKYFEMGVGEPDWSELTPGYDATIECTKNRWVFDNMKDGTNEFRKKIEQAAGCADFLLVARGVPE